MSSLRVPRTDIKYIVHHMDARNAFFNSVSDEIEQIDQEVASRGIFVSDSVAKLSETIYYYVNVDTKQLGTAKDVFSRLKKGLAKREYLEKGEKDLVMVFQRLGKMQDERGVSKQYLKDRRHWVQQGQFEESEMDRIDTTNSSSQDLKSSKGKDVAAQVVKAAVSEILAGQPATARTLNPGAQQRSGSTENGASDSFEQEDMLAYVFLDEAGRQHVSRGKVVADEGGEVQDGNEVDEDGFELGSRYTPAQRH